MSAQTLYRANWRAFRPTAAASVNLLNGAKMAECKTCTCDGKVYLMTRYRSLYCFDPSSFSWRELHIWENNPLPSKDFVLASNGNVLYYVSDNLSNQSNMQVVFIDPKKGEITDCIQTSKVAMSSSPGLWSFDAADSKSVFIPTRDWVVELTSTGMDTWGATHQHYDEADAYFAYTQSKKKFLGPAQLPETLFVSLRMNQNKAFVHAPEFGERQTLLFMPQFEGRARHPISFENVLISSQIEIHDLPKTRYFLQYYNWIVIVGVETASSPKEHVTNIRLWVMDFDKEFAKSQNGHTMKWNEVDIQGRMPNLDAVHSVTMLDEKIVVLGSNLDPATLILDVDVLDQVSTTRSSLTDNCGRPKSAKMKSMKHSEMEIMALQQEKRRSDATNRLAIESLRKELNEAQSQNQKLQKTMEYETKVAKEELRNVKEESKKLKKQLETTRNSQEKSSQAVNELQHKLNAEKEKLNKQISSFRSDLDKVKSSKERAEQNLNDLNAKHAAEKEEINKLVDSLKQENARYKNGSDLQVLTLQQLRELQNGLKLTLVKVKNEIGDRTETTNCLICTERPRNMIFSPCHHMCVCDKCASTMRDVKCPMCRANGKLFKVYL